MIKENIKILNTEERATATVFTMLIEYEGKEYTWRAYSSDTDSYIEWFDESWLMIDQPDWANDLDMWEEYRKNEGEL